MNIPNRNLLLLALAAMLAAAAPACGSDDGKDTGPGVEPPDTGGEICDNGTDDDGDGATDCEDPNCLVLEACAATGCTEQIPACEGDRAGRINLICLEGACEPAGQSEDGTLLRGDLMVFNRLDQRLESLAARNKAYLVELFHPLRPDGARATCDDLFVAGLDGGPIAGFNLVGSASQGISNATANVPAAAFNMPVPPEEGYLVLTRYYGARDVNGDPVGELVGLGCQEGVTYPAGTYVEEEERQTTVTILPVCDPSNDTCTDGKTCQFGSLLCRDKRCGDECTALENETCRSVGEEPMCLTICDPEHPERTPCPAGHRCDSTQGERPACVPVEG